jgi:hypothetical protein
MKKLLPLVVLAVGAAYVPSQAVAQGTMLMRGVYTTPEISARCQQIVQRFSPSSGSGDTQRQAQFIACVRKLYSQQYGATPSTAGVAPAAGAAAAAIVEAPVAAATAVTAPVTGLGYTAGGYATDGYAAGGYVPAWEGFNSVYTAGECITDEGFGRIGLCNGVVQ